MALSKELTREITELLDHERWMGHVSGKIEGAMNVLYAMELDKEDRLRLLAEAVGLSQETALSYIEPREVEERIFRNTSLRSEDKKSLLKLMRNDAIGYRAYENDSRRVLRDPATIKVVLNRFLNDEDLRAEVRKVKKAYVYPYDYECRVSCMSKYEVGKICRELRGIGSRHHLRLRIVADVSLES